MRAVRSVGRFLYALVVGDDWRLPVGIFTCLALAALLLATPIPAEIVAVVCGCAVAAWFSLCVLRDSRSHPPGGADGPIIAERRATPIRPRSKNAGLSTPQRSDVDR